MAPLGLVLTEDGEDDHEEAEQQEDVHEGWQGLEDLSQVSVGGERAGWGWEWG